MLWMEILENHGLVAPQSLGREARRCTLKCAGTHSDEPLLPNLGEIVAVRKARLALVLGARIVVGENTEHPRESRIPGVVDPAEQSRNRRRDPGTRRRLEESLGREDV